MPERDVLEPRFRALADSVPVLLWIAGDDGGCVFFNRRWLDFTGRGLDEAMGSGWATSVHPDDLDRCVATFTDALARREPFEGRYRLRRADGAWREVLDRAVPLFDDAGRFSGFVGAGIDLSERREADEALQRSRQDREAAMAAGRMGTFDLDLATNAIWRDR